MFYHRRHGRKNRCGPFGATRDIAMRCVIEFFYSMLSNFLFYAFREHGLLCAFTLRESYAMIAMIGMMAGGG